MEVFGVVAGACTLTAEMLRLSRSLRKMIKSVKHAPREIGKIADETTLFAELFQTFLDNCSKSPASDPQTYFSPESLIAWTESAIHGLGTLLRKVEALSSDPMSEYSPIETLTAHIKWYFNSNAVGCLRASLNVARESINSYTNMRCIEMLDEQLRVLMQAIRDGRRQAVEAEVGMTVEERLNFLNRSIQNRRVVRHAIDKRLQKAKEKVLVHQGKNQGLDFVPKTNELLEFTESVEQYVEHVLPPTRAGSGIRKPDQFRELKHASRRPDIKRPGPSIVTTPVVSDSRGADLGPLYHHAKSPTALEGLSKRSRIVKGPPSSSIDTSSAYSYDSATGSSRHSSRSPSPIASTSSTWTFRSKNAAPPTTTSNNKYSNRTYHGSRAKEYINDPAGTILSPPKPKNHSASTDSETDPLGDWQNKNGKATSKGVMETSAPPRDPRERGVRSDYDQSEESHVTEKEYESESEAETGEEHLNEGPSPFHPIAGVLGKFPPRWHQRNQRSESPQDFW